MKILQSRSSKIKTLVLELDDLPVCPLKSCHVYHKNGYGWNTYLFIQRHHEVWSTPVNSFWRCYAWLRSLHCAVFIVHTAVVFLKSMYCDFCPASLFIKDVLCSGFNSKLIYTSYFCFFFEWVCLVSTDFNKIMHLNSEYCTTSVVSINWDV